MLLNYLGFNEGISEDDAVAILVGPNGSGKSIHLQEIATQYRNRRGVTILSNTAYGRLNSIRNVNRFSVGHRNSSPKKIIKAVVSESLDRNDSTFYHISSVLNYCRYRSRFGFGLEGYRPDILEILQNSGSDVDELFLSIQERHDFEDAIRFIKNWGSENPVWIDYDGPIHEFSMRREFAAVLRSEKILTRIKVLKKIRVFLEKKDGKTLELQHASSGELSLISSLIFLVATVENNSIVLIDEPENSLHPSWQREYVSKIFSALSYRNVSVIIATHSPLVVTGAITEHPNLVSVYQMKARAPSRLNLTGTVANNTGIESILWNAFETVTPANHFISESIVEAIHLFERDEINKEQILFLINDMSAKSFDRKQEEFFQALLALVEKVEIRKNNRSSQGSAP